MHRRSLASIGLTLALALLATAAGAQDRPPFPQTPQIVAQGTAEVKVAPDRAIVRFGSQFQAADARTAQGRVNDAMQRVVQAVRRLNVPENRISTERLDLFPIYEQPAPGREGSQRLVGYRAANVVRVEMDATANLGPVLDAAVGAGANTIEGIQFTLANEAPHRQRALQQAAQEARAKAQTIATALDTRLGRLLEASEGGVEVTPPRPLMFERAALAATPVEPGEVSLRATVTVRYAIGP